MSTIPTQHDVGQQTGSDLVRPFRFDVAETTLVDLRSCT
jgi:hypothetical protein